MIAEAPTTCAPASRATSIVSRVDPPVVITSSTTTHPIGRFDAKAAAQHQAAILPLRKDRAHPEARADLLADDDAAERRRQHDGRLQVTRQVADRVAESRGEIRILQHERALEVSLAVQTGCSLKCPSRQRAGRAEQIENGFGIHLGRLSVPRRAQVVFEQLRIRLYSSAQLVSSVKLWFSTGYGATDQFSLRSSISR
jgi:hypothetical protein